MKTQHLRHSFYLFLCAILTTTVASANVPNKLFSEIKPYADMANAAYLPKQEVQKIVDSHGYRLEQYSSVPGVEVNYFVATNDALKHQIISVRGTANIENAIVDVSLKLLPDEHAQISLHQGFSEAAEGIYSALLPSLNKDYKISTTGHSLGGAVAVILAIYLDTDQYSLGTIYTFGQPKVTNVGGALAFKHLKINRIVTSLDLVPLVPPLDVMDINNIDIYWHLGKEIVLLKEHDYAELAGVKSMMRATKIVNAQLSQESLEHHMMSNYLEQVERKTESANLVPYNTSVNLLKLFGM
ncbi:lipase family protein [Pseudomonadota bacterium]